jgi:signal transduction histidine kinase/ActR/RegA family two-component response regulator/HAMP domain-containing protein
MRRLSIARSLRLALIGLTIVLAIVAATGVASLYDARQRYEDKLAQTSQLATAVANLNSAAISEAEVLRDARGPTASSERYRARAAFDAAAAGAVRLARPDPASARLVAQEIGLQHAVRRLAPAGRLGTAAGGGPLAQATLVAERLQTRQQARQAGARATARSQSRMAIGLVIAAGVLALIAALALIAVLVRSMRRPLDALVDATQGLAAGDLARRVEPAGPRELQDLGAAFNAMGADLAGAQARIEEERRRLAITIESLGDALIVTAPGSGIITTANPRAAELVPELEPGRQIDAGASPLPPLSTALARETVIEHGGRILAVTAALLGSESDGVVWTVRDVTERSRLERAKSEFVATASHELRSPLTSIKGFVELLERSPENMSARQREFIDIILRSTDRLVELVNDLLDVARIEADSVEISRRPIDIGEAVRDVVELMRPRLEERHQQLGVYVAPTLPMALADPGRIRQIIANLLTNAHLYTEDGGRIHIGVEADRAWVRIVVADSGIGMTAVERERVFDRFYRAHASGASTPGTGLGLSIVKSLVDLHEGEVEVESEPGRGTTFHVLIPAAIVGADAGQSLEVIRGRRILIVDDEADIADLIAGQLAPLDIHTTIARTGAQALAHLREQRYDAVTLDILMPDMDGFEVLREIRADPELRATPILFVSVFAGRKELAGEWVVSKPIDADELRDVLAAAVRAGRSRVLVVGREEMQPTLEPALDELGIEHHWEVTGAAAARVCSERRFEVALIDVGIRNPQAALQALDLRGRRLRRAVILFSDGDTPTPSGIVKLGMEVVPVEDAAQALLIALRGDREHARFKDGWSSEARLS